MIRTGCSPTWTASSRRAKRFRPDEDEGRGLLDLPDFRLGHLLGYRYIDNRRADRVERRPDRRIPAVLPLQHRAHGPAPTRNPAPPMVERLTWADLFPPGSGGYRDRHRP